MQLVTLTFLHCHGVYGTQTAKSLLRKFEHILIRIFETVIEIMLILPVKRKVSELDAFALNF